MKRHNYRTLGTHWTWKPWPQVYPFHPCERCGLAFTAKWHRRLR